MASFITKTIQALKKKFQATEGAVSNTSFKKEISSY
jgi:hypothetical protein